jgi:UDP-glucose 4-epimerase
VNTFKNLLITGGAGFVGVNLVQHLLATRQYKITIIDNLSTGNFELLKEIVAGIGGEVEEQFSTDAQKVCFYKVDILDRDDVAKILKGQHLIVHLAAQTGVMPSLKDPHYDASINVFGTLNLLAAAAENQIQRFIFSSSAAPVGEQTPPIHEAKLPRPLSPYGASKLACEGYCHAFFGSYGLDTVVLRFSNLYGPNSHHKGSVIAHFIKKLLKQEPLTVYGDGDQTRDFLFTGDIVRAIHTILQHSQTPIGGELFQLGTEVETSVNHLIQLLTEVTGINPQIIHEPERKGEIKRNYTSIEKIKQQLNYQPQYQLNKGLQQTWQWFHDRK